MRTIEPINPHSKNITKVIHTLFYRHEQRNKAAIKPTQTDEEFIHYEAAMQIIDSKELCSHLKDNQATLVLLGTLFSEGVTLKIHPPVAPASTPNIHPLVSDLVDNLTTLARIRKTSEVAILIAFAKKFIAQPRIFLGSHEVAIRKVADFFISQPKPLLDCDYLQVIKETLSILIFPETLNQTNRGLCGVDVFIRELAEKSPEQFTALCLDIATTGKSATPFETQANSTYFSSETSLMPAVMAAIRHTHNLIGYNPHHFKFIEKIQSLTHPKDIAEWFEKAGFEVQAENMRTRTEDFSAYPSLLTSLFRLHSKQHSTFDSENNFRLLQAATHDSSLTSIALISSPFSDVLDSIAGLDKMAGQTPDTFLFAQVGHYVKFLELAENADKTVNFKVATWGRIICVEKMPRELFDKHCAGILVAKHQLQQTFAPTPSL